MTDRQIQFWKMDGSGNEFIILDGREHAVSLNEAQVRALADPSNEITKGCDQVIVLEPSQDPEAHVFMRIYNADGGQVDACGNASRCVAWLVGQERGQDNIHIQTNAGLLYTYGGLPTEGSVAVDMGPARLTWNEIPLAESRDTLHLDINEGPLSDPVAVSMGNPHMVFFVDDVEEVDLATLGPKLEHHPLFPERVNVGVAQILSYERMRLRVWERGVGETAACGTGACAAVVASARRELTGRNVTVTTNGGDLVIEWLDDDNVMMLGPTRMQFEGRLDLSALV